MPIALPYRFDTSPVVKLILGGVLGLVFLIIVPGIAYSLFVSHDRTAAVQLLLTGLIAAYFGRLFTKHLQGSRGMITSDAIVVEPASLSTASDWPDRWADFRCSSFRRFGSNGFRLLPWFKGGTTSG
jgi:hypothetical protein